MAVDGATKEKKKKKKIKLEDVQDAGDTNVMACHDVSVQTVVKKEEPLDVNIRGGEKQESDAGEKKKKKKKKVKEEVEADSPVCCDASVQTVVKTERSDINISDAPEKTKKKKKKKKIKQEAEQIQEDGDHLLSKKKKAKKQGYEDEVEGIKKKEKVKEGEADLEHSVEIVKKKKKKKRKTDDVPEQEQNAELADGEMKKRKKQKGADECEEEEQKVKKKKKKKKRSSAGEEPDEITSDKRVEEKSKKLKKKLKSLEEGKDANGGRESSSDKKMKKKVKAMADDVIEIKEEPVGKKKSKYDRNKTPEKVQMKKIKEERYEDVVETASKASDVVFLSEKPGNQDEVSIDQARRLALQREIDKESQPKMNLGQWGTAQFDSADRQAKFLRLMGGFKKSSQPLTGFAGQANVALGKEGQQTLQQGLLGEFERAQSRHMDFRNKGNGLGFAAPSNKLFCDRC